MFLGIKRKKNSPRRVLVSAQANIASTTGGSITVFFHFCSLIADLGYEVCGACHSEDPSRPVLLDGRVRFVNFRYCYEGVSAYDKAFNRLVGDFNPDLIVFFFPHYCLEARLKRRFRDIPRIIMFHSRPDYLFAQLPDFEERLRPYYVNTRAQVLLESYRDLLPDYIRGGKVYVIGNGIRQFPEERDYAAEHKRMVYFSRIDSLKGVDLLLEAMAMVKEKHPDWAVDVYGDVEPEEYGEELKGTIASKGLEGQVRLMGKSSRSTEETLQDYDFCVFPSRVEGFSIGLGETMSAGLATVGFRFCSGVSEMIVDGESGILCDDTEGFAEAICRLIENTAERERMGRNAHSSMLQYAPELIDSQWTALIQSMLK